MLHFICKSGVRGAASNQTHTLPVPQRGFVCRIRETKNPKELIRWRCDPCWTVCWLEDCHYFHALHLTCLSRNISRIVAIRMATVAGGRVLKDHPVTQRCQISSTRHRDARSSQSLYIFGISVKASTWAQQFNILECREKILAKTEAEMSPFNTNSVEQKTSIKLSSWKKPQQKCRWFW